MRLLIKGARTKEAAHELGVSEHTVRMHLDRAMRRHQARSRAQLVSRFSQQNT
jgi:DNA-binding CsgD family transcriptional regulator